ncbi:MAG: hypothetical protein JWR51_3130 [Devosia sp.]|nr:hypothetical protein [Devosia sp.]
MMKYPDDANALGNHLVNDHVRALRLRSNRPTTFRSFATSVRKHCKKRKRPVQFVMIAIGGLFAEIDKSLFINFDQITLSRFA